MLFYIFKEAIDHHQLSDGIAQKVFFGN